MEQVRVCRFCGYIEAVPSSNRCANCEAFSGMISVPRAEAERLSRSRRFGFLRSRLLIPGIALAVTALLAFWVSWNYLGLAPNPPAASTDVAPTLDPGTGRRRGAREKAPGSPQTLSHIPMRLSGPTVQAAPCSTHRPWRATWFTLLRRPASSSRWTGHRACRSGRILQGFLQALPPPWQGGWWSTPFGLAGYWPWMR